MHRPVALLAVVALAAACAPAAPPALVPGNGRFVLTAAAGATGPDLAGMTVVDQPAAQAAQAVDGPQPGPVTPPPTPAASPSEPPAPTPSPTATPRSRSGGGGSRRATPTPGPGIALEAADGGFADPVATEAAVVGP